MTARTKSMCVALASVCVASAAGKARAQDAQPDEEKPIKVVKGTEAEKYDVDPPDGYLRGAEVRRFVLYTKNPILAKIDEDKKGVTTADWEKFFAANEKGGEELGFLVREFGGRTSADLAKAIKPEAEKPVSLGQLLLRKSIDDLGELKKAEAAHLSYTRDFLKDADIWMAKGALIYTGWEFESPPTSSLKFLPSLSFDRVADGTDTKKTKKKKSVNSLTPRVGVEWESMPEDSDWMHLVRADVAYATSFAFHKRVRAFEAEYEPVNVDWGLGAGRMLFDEAVEYRARVIAHAESGYVMESAGDKDLKEGRGFSRGGPKLVLDLWPFPHAFDGRLKLEAKYAALWATSGRPKNSHLVEGTLSYALGPNLTIEITYQEGRVPLLDERTETLTVGLGVKF